MQVTGAIAPIFALFGFGSGEVILILALLIILYGSKKLPEIARGMGEGISEVRKALWNALRAGDRRAEDAGKSLGGIYGKPAAEALTPDNQTAELYDPAALRDKDRTGGSRKPTAFLTWSRLWRWIRHFVFKRRKRIINVRFDTAVRARLVAETVRARVRLVSLSKLSEMALIALVRMPS